MATSNPTDLADGDIVSETWVDAVAQHVVRVYSSTAARDADLTSPHVGQQVYISSNDSSEGWYTYTSAGTWRRLDWFSAWGQVASATLSADTSPGTSLTDITGASVTWTAVANRRYRYRLYLPRVIQNTGAGEIALILTNSANTNVGSPLGRWNQYMNGANYTATPYIETFETGIAAGSVTRKIRGNTTANTFTVQAATYGGSFTVYDDGPAGVPA